MILKFLRLSERHLEQVRQWRNLPAVKQYMLTERQISAEDQKKWFEKIKNDLTKKYWVVNVDGKDIGVVNLDNIDLENQRCTWGVYIGEESERGKGVGQQVELHVMRYVFETLRLNKFWGQTLESNERMLAIHRKCGYTVEGTLREHIYKDQNFHNVVVVSILRKEWEKIKSNFPIGEADFE